MTLAGCFRLLLLGTVMLSLAAYALAEEQPIVLAVLAALAVTGWWVTERRASTWKGVPRWMSSAILLGMCGAAALAAWSGIELVSVFAGFLTSIIILKLWELRQLRDYGQLLTMSLFLTVASTLTNNSLLLGVTLLVQLPVFVGAVLLFQIYAAQQRAREALPSSTPPEEEDRQAWRSAGRPLAGVATVTVLTSVAVAVLVFVFIPRGIGLGDLGDFARPRIGKQTGFSDRVEPGSGGLISESQATVMEVDVWTRDARHREGSADEHLYLRGAVLDRYERGVWTRSVPDGSSRFGTSHPVRGQTTVVSREPRGTVRTMTTEVRVRQPLVGETPVFHVYRPIDVCFLENERGTDVVYDLKTGGMTREGDGSIVRYQVRSAQDQELPEAAGDTGRAREATSFPSKRVTDLAAELLSQAGYDPDPATRPASKDGAASRVFETHLRTRYAYTLNVGEAPPGIDSTEWFLFTAKRGHCEYFASALAALCRSSGIEARMIAGYVATEYDQRRRGYIVRASNAHAWVEVNAGPSGWQVRDGTPTSNFEAMRAAQSGLLARLGRVFDSLQGAWTTSVVTFDNSTQQKLFSASGIDAGPIDGLVDRARRILRGLRRGDSRSEDVVATGLKVCLGLVGAGLAWLVWRLVRARTRRPRTVRSGWAMTGPERDLYRALIRALARRGFQKPGWQPPMAFMEEVRQRDPSLAAGAEPALQLLYSVRFGGKPAEAGSLKAAIRSASRL